MAASSAGHQPVMVAEVVHALVRRPGGLYVDATVGTGGHSGAILQSAGPAARLVAVDQDADALAVAAQRLRSQEGQVIFRHGHFGELGAILDDLGLASVDGMLFDLGVSSPQLETPGRGFSFQTAGPLDMRMDRRQSLTAATVVNQWPEAALADLLIRYGQERWARRIARAIVRARPLTTTVELAACVARALPRGRAWQRIHPATRTFQALRIAVNRELERLEAALPQAIARLAPGGRLAVLAYHSLEDRVVKTVFRQAAASGKFRFATRTPQRPSAEEVWENPRARSARLRVGERIG